MINFTPRLNKAINTAALAHGQINQTRKGSTIPYIVHPFGVMLIASQVTDDEDVLIACLFHDIIEDVETVDPDIYNQAKMRQDFGDKVTDIVLDVSHDDSIKDWHAQQIAYNDHIKNKASKEAVIVCIADKIHNLGAMVDDYKIVGKKLADRFTTVNLQDQIKKYQDHIEVLEYRQAPPLLLDQLKSLHQEFTQLVN